MVSRVLDDKTRDRRVLQKVLALLKKHLPRYPPTYEETLLALDRFPATQEGEGVGQVRWGVPGRASPHAVRRPCSTFARSSSINSRAEPARPTDAPPPMWARPAARWAPP